MAVPTSSSFLFRRRDTSSPSSTSPTCCSNVAWSSPSWSSPLTSLSSNLSSPSTRPPLSNLCFSLLLQTTPLPQRADSSGNYAPSPNSATPSSSGSDRTPRPPVAIVSDFFLGWTHSLALDLAVPRVVFWASGAFATSVFNSQWRDLPKNDDPGNDDSPISFPHIPNCPMYPWRQLSHVYREYREGDPDWEFFRDGMLANLKGWGALLNSFDQLERVYIDHLKKEFGHDRLWTVGPLLPSDGDLTVLVDRGGSSSVPAHRLMTWLDHKEDDSVVYVCFGSHFTQSEQQVEVLAAALECSGVHFVWCVKPSDERHVEIIDGVEDRVKDRSFIVRGWAPQVAVLRHRAVGAFVTHCGWNSAVEGLSAGVMMLTWPMGADQFTNAKLLVDQLGVAVRACEGGDWSVPDRAELARMITESVTEAWPERARVVQLRDAATAAVGGGGSSSRDLDDFVKQLSELRR